MLIVNSRVTSALPRTFRPRNFHASCACASRSAGRREPTRGGIVDSSGPSTSASPPSHASQRSNASASGEENFAISARRRAGS